MILIWKATLILSAGFAAGFVLRRASASSRHFTWLLTMASLLALPFVERLLPAWKTLSPALIHIDSSSVAAQTAASPLFQWTYLWLAGAGIVLFRFLAGLWRLRAMTATARESQVDGIPVLFGDDAPVPLAWSRILLPSAAGNWDPAVLRSVVLHEHCHLLRRDPLIEAICAVVCSIYWFHPLVWLAARQMRRERELACDDRVLDLGVSPADYAQHMIQIARWMRPSYTPAPSAGESSQLETRVTAILASGRRRRRVGVAAVLAGTAFCIGILLPVASAQEKIYKIGGDVKAPKLVYKVEPKYTQEAREAKIEGAVALSVVVTAQGVANEIRIKKSLAAGLDDNAIEAVSKWRFEPGTKAGTPVAVQAVIEVNFRLL